MIYDMIAYLLYALVAVAFLQPSAPRLFAALVFVGITLSHEALLSEYDGLYYYGSAALFDLAIMVLTSFIRPTPRVVLTLHKICMVSVLVNFAGWALWFFYLPPLAYDIAFVALYSWALITLIARNGHYVGGYTLDSWSSCFRFNSSARGLNTNKHGGPV